MRKTSSKQETLLWRYGLLALILLLAGSGVFAQTKVDAATQIKNWPNSPADLKANCSGTAGVDDGIRYWSINGSDANTGCSPGAAKLTSYAAACSLPGGNCATQTAGTGVVIGLGGSGTTALRANPTSGAGLWFMGSSNDPNWSSPPAGWLKLTGALKITCLSGQYHASGGSIPACNIAGGSNSDTNHPFLWISSSAQTLTFENLLNSYSGVCAKVGIDSTGSLTNGGSENITFNNVQFLPLNSVGLGPCVMIGSNTFWVRFGHSIFYGNSAERSPISSISRSSNVVTVTTTSSHPFQNGEMGGIWGVTDPSFNGSFTFTKTGANTFTYPQNGPNASSTGGTAFSDKAQAVVLDAGGNSVVGDDLIWMDDIEMQNGSIKDYAGTNVSSLYASYVTQEGWDAPPIWRSGTNSSTHDIYKYIEIADPISAFSIPAVYNEAISSPSQAISAEGLFGYGPNGWGPMSLLGGDYSTNILSYPAQPGMNGQVGFQVGHIIGQTDVGRRLGAPLAVRFTNSANSDSTTWTDSQYAGTTMVTTGVTDPFGGTNAAQATSTASSPNEQLYMMPISNHTYAAGDYVVLGVWVRMLGSSFIGINLGIDSGIVPSGANAIQSCHGGMSSGDGEWQWQWCTVKVQTAGTWQTMFAVDFRLNYGIQAFGPVLNYIPASAGLSDNEVYEYANGLASYASACAVGTACGMNGRILTEPAFGTLANCSVNSTSPAACGFATSGSLVVPTSTTSYTVNTTAVTAHSRIFIVPVSDASDLPSSPRCNAPASGYFGESARSVGTSFTFVLPSTSGTTCWNYWIVN